MRRIVGLLMVAAGAAASGCGEYVRDQGRAPAQVVIAGLTGASGAEPAKFGGTLFSDVITNVKETVNGTQVEVPTTYSDLGQVQMSLILKDPGPPANNASPSDLNQVTFSRYHVVYRRTDGRNTPGVDVPFPFDGGLTFTVPASGDVKVTFEIVRHDAKHEAPLLALRNSPVIIGAIAEVTFYGRDQAGNEVSASGTIQAEFGDFGDPQ
jgi:hypothetical protein